jgi:DNA-binding transcriptional LysR family regulator
MQVKVFKLFCDIVAQRSFSEAAVENGMSQPAASQLVSQVEEEFGVKLFDRSTRPFGLTAAGEVFHARCRRVLEQLETLDRELQAVAAAERGQIQVASIYSVGLSHMNRFVRDFLSRFPKSNVRIEYQHPDRVYEMVEQGQAHLGLVSYPKQSRTIGVMPWRVEQLVIACPPDHELAGLAQASLRQLHGLEMVGYDEHLTICREIERALIQADVEVKVVMRFDNTETMKRAIEAGAGVGLLPEPTMDREIEAGSLVGVPIADKPLVRPLGIVYRRGKELSPDAKCFTDLLLEQASVTSSVATAMAPANAASSVVEAT